MKCLSFLRTWQINIQAGDAFRADVETVKQLSVRHLPDAGVFLCCPLDQRAKEAQRLYAARSSPSAPWWPPPAEAITR